MDEHSYGANEGDCILLLVVATLLNSGDPELENIRESLGDSAPDRFLSLVEESSLLVGQRLSRLLHSLARPFNDDECEYGGEYYEGSIGYPLRFVAPSQSSECSGVVGFQWDDGDELQKGLGFLDKKSGDLKVAIFISLERCDGNCGGYELYLSHVEDYLCQPLVQIAAYSDASAALKIAEYSSSKRIRNINGKEASSFLSDYSISCREDKAMSQAF
ncbi:hypothetical protein CB0101_10005 [Synechococcus sp. CB0101]|uniref:hypothetical protein n=1 Tax=Synechococcus sp. CB0101 TaxID=232348 RepID=UPI0010C41925|nr:hypothetical protein [Synechococcus sp. CB0101]QCH15219.1 hypothetical protein CB0101_10005 [Synechococcus sp. CB0101]